MTEQAVDALPEAIRPRSPSMHAVIYRDAEGNLSIQEVGTFGEVKDFTKTLDPTQVEFVYKVSKKITPKVKQVVHF